MPDKEKRKFFDPAFFPLERRNSTILACILLWSILSFLFIRYFLFGTIEVQGTSMNPTLWSGDRLLVHRWVYFFGRPERYDVVVIRHPKDRSLSIKRVIGLPGELVHVRSTGVYLDGLKLEEPYLSRSRSPETLSLRPVTQKVGPDHYFVLGDNRTSSEDSRVFGPLPQKLILGKVFVKENSPKKP